jgi:flagellar protein FliS
MSPSRAALKQYAAVQVQTSVAEATPHRLTAMLFEGVLERIARAKGHLQRGEVAAKCQLISASVAIVSELAGSLNRDAAPDLVDRLSGLYDYVLRRLSEANASNRAEPLDEASRLLGSLAEAWQAIDPDQPSAQAANG